MIGTKTGCSRALSGALTQPEQLVNEQPSKQRQRLSAEHPSAHPQPQPRGGSRGRGPRLRVSLEAWPLTPPQINNSPCTMLHGP